MFTRPLVSADFVRLRVYAPLVKTVVEPYIISTKDVLSPSVWTVFREHDIGSLFNLSFLHYVSLSSSEGTQQRADPIHNFICPSLLKFCLILQGGKDYEDLIQDPEGPLEARPDPVLLDILAHLSSHCPRIRHFELDTTPFPFYAADSLDAAVCRWSYLRSFEAHTCPLRPEALKHLAALPSLRLLNTFIDLPPADLVDILLPHSEAPLVFPALHELALHAPHLTICTRMLELIESMILTKISIYAYAHASPEDIRGVLSALAACGSRDTIIDLLVRPGCATHSAPPLQPHGALRIQIQRTTTTTTTCTPPAAARPAPPNRALPAPLPQATPAALPARALLRLPPRDDARRDGARAPAPRHRRALPDAAADPRVALAGLAELTRFRALRSAQLSLADVDERAVSDAFARQGMPAGPRSEPRRAGTGNNFGVVPAPASPEPEPEPEPAPTPAPTSTSTPDSDPGQDDHGPDDADRGTDSSLLWCLAVGHARIAESCVEGTAAALSAWFPHLAGTNFTLDPDSDGPVLRAMGFRDDEDAAEVRRRWQRVGELVGAFARVRKQERRWAADHWHRSPG
ncbi:hypothetical protein V8D89_012675 [Ganoderma adspersum]